MSNKQTSDVLKLSDIIVKKEYIPDFHKDILLIAGGTGITPMMQLLEVNDRVRFTLIFCNLSEKDIFLMDKLRKYDNLKIFHVLEKMEIEKDGFFMGRINYEIVKNIAILDNELLYDFAYVCGPPEFVKVVCGEKAEDKSQGKLAGILKKIGFRGNQVFKF